MMGLKIALWQLGTMPEKEKALGAYNKQYKQGCRSVVSIATNLETKDAQKIKMIKKKIIRKQKILKIKTENSKECATIVNRRGI